MQGPEQFSEIQRRIRARLKALGNPSPSSLAQRHGLGRDFIRDLIAEPPRKKNITSEKIGALAQALRCEVAFLTLDQPEPIAAQDGGPLSGARVASAEFVGYLEVDAWRVPKAEIAVPRPFSPLLILSEVNGKHQKFGIIRGREMEGVGLFSEMIIVAIVQDDGIPRDGEIVIAERRRDELIELSARVVRYVAGGAQLVTAPNVGDPQYVPLMGARILGAVTYAIRMVNPHDVFQLIGGVRPRT